MMPVSANHRNMNMSKRSFSFCVTLAFWCASNLAAQSPAGDNENSTTPDEVVPGVPLDGSIIIDESIWLSLLGEPGRHMTEAYDHVTAGKSPEAAASIGKAASFLFIAAQNAFKGPKPDVQKAAMALDNLSRCVAAGKVKSADELKPVFSRAHLAMSRHHAEKAADACASQRWAVAGNYLASSTRHLERASYWAGSDLPTDTRRSLADAKEAAGRLVEEGGNSVEQAGQLIERLGKRIERFGQSLRGGSPGTK